MKLWKFLYVFTFILSVNTATSTQPSSVKNKHLQLSVMPSSDNWQPANVADVMMVTLSVADVLKTQFPSTGVITVRLKNQKEGPKTLFKKGNNGETIVLVDIQGRDWSKLSYQFSHELCHILSNHKNISKRNQWFDESLCESISLYALDKMAVRWKHKPPYKNWKSYAVELQKYLDHYLQEKHRVTQLPLSKWYQQNKNSLRKDPYIRAKNEVVGTKIYQLIKSGDFLVSTIQYLNTNPSKNHSTLSFSEYLSHWYKNSPPKNKPSVKNIAKLFNITISL